MKVYIYMYVYIYTDTNTHTAGGTFAARQASPRRSPFPPPPGPRTGSFLSRRMYSLIGFKKSTFPQNHQLIVDDY